MWSASVFLTSNLVLSISCSAQSSPNYSGIFKYGDHFPPIAFQLWCDKIFLANYKIKYDSAENIHNPILHIISDYSHYSSQQEFANSHSRVFSACWQVGANGAPRVWLLSVCFFRLKSIIFYSVSLVMLHQCSISDSIAWVHRSYHNHGIRISDYHVIWFVSFKLLTFQDQARSDERTCSKEGQERGEGRWVRMISLSHFPISDSCLDKER